MKNWRSQFKDWLKEICPWDNIEDYVQFEGEYPKDWKLKKDLIRVNERRHFHSDRIGVLIYTKDHSYQIGAKETYLGCIASCRKPRAGEDWTRGSDLPDGKFNRETWERIKNAIARYELVKIAKKQKAMAETPILPKAK